MRNAGIRADTDEWQESLAKRIREARVLRLPYVCVVGAGRFIHRLGAEILTRSKRLAGAGAEA